MAPGEPTHREYFVTLIVRSALVAAVCSRGVMILLKQRYYN